VTTHVAFIVGSSTDDTVIVAVPYPLAVTTPWFTVATVSSLLLHATVCTASAGSTVALSVTV
jgi:hypothetical protein